MCFANFFVAIVILFPRQDHVAKLRNRDDSSGDTSGPDFSPERVPMADGE